MTRKTTGPRKRADKLAQAGRIKCQLWIEVMERTFEVKVRKIGWCTVTRTGDKHRIEIVAKDDSIQMGVNEIDSRTGPPMAKEPVFDVFRPKGFSQLHVVLQINLRASEIIGGSQITRKRGYGIRIFCGCKNCPHNFESLPGDGAAAAFACEQIDICLVFRARG
jgi:hypothetical protein